MRNPRPSTSSPIRTRRPAAWRLGLLALGVSLFGPAAGAADRPAGPVLHLRNGGYMPGALSPTDHAGAVRWQASAFVSPFEFSWNTVNSIHFQSSWELPKGDGPYAVELAGGDTVFARLVELDDREAVLDLPRLGRLRLPRSRILRMDRRRAGSELIYLGPNGLLGWQEAAAEKLWREDAGQVVTERQGAVLRGDFGIPPRAIIEFQVSWKNKPDFVLALAVDDDEQTPRRAFRFEVWESALVVHRETEKDADVASLQEIPAGPGSVHLLAYLDQEQGRIVVVSPAGKTLADITLPDAERKAYTGLLLANNNGSLSLERLRISRWTGPVAAETGETSSLGLADGSAVNGRVVRFDPGSKEFVVQGPDAESRVAEDRVASVRLSNAAEVPARTVRVSTLDGGQLSGEVSKVTAEEIALAIPGVDQELKVPIAELRSLAVGHREPTPPVDDEQMLLLELEDTRLFGRIAEAPGKSGAHGLAWKPIGSTTSSLFRGGVSGRIVSNWWDPATSRQTSTLTTARVEFGAPGNNPFRAPSNVTITNRRVNAANRHIYLRAGDILPGEVTNIDEKGVGIRSIHSENSVIPHDKIKAVDLGLDGLRGLALLSKAKRDRLLTLPRLQKDNPPTHLIGSTNGDFLRGRLIRMDEKELEVEVRLEVKKLPRDRIARIIWLHPESLKPEQDKPKPQAQPSPELQVLAICRDGVRLTFAPELVVDGALIGKSDVLGRCQVRLKDLTQLLIGKGTEQGASPLSYQQWTLTPAPEPNVSLAGEEGDAPARSTERASVLVGKPAPDFELALLDGEKFHLAENKGKVVVLDFWATWCGPCLQAMPQVDRVTREFRDQDVRLIAVNLEETPKQITAMLERQKMDLTVALDREGRVAEKYKANAIPQTVIIDKEGKVAHLFVGSSPRLGDELRDALKAVLARGAKEPSPDKP